MIVHYNIKPGVQKHMHQGQIAIFYLGDCEPVVLLKVASMIKDRLLDRSIGRVFYADWEYIPEQGTIRIESALGCDLATFQSACDLIIQECNKL